MRYDAEHKQKTREKVLKAAAKAIRADGPHRVGVADVMAKAGLTHGGFYAHFSSKDDLIAAAIEQMFEESRARVLRETADKPPREALRSYIDFYLSPTHRDARRSGCPVASLSSDLPRLADSTREAFARGVRRLTGRLAELIGQCGMAHPKELATSALSELLGALSLARLEPDAERSDAILADSRGALKKRLGLEK
jgi:TetR/AcrR family transcriptional repressor of nem operon